MTEYPKGFLRWEDDDPDFQGLVQETLEESEYITAEQVGAGLEVREVLDG